MSFSVTDRTQRLRTSGLRVTAARLAVLAALDEFPHSTAKAVTETVRTGLGHISTQAVYDVLTACESSGLVRRIEPPGSPARYETRTGDNHHHLLCSRCGRVADVDCVVGHQPCLTPSDYQGFRVETAQVLFIGTCPECLETDAQPDVKRGN
ncbi:Fur family transcriptional regulator [Spelaeicoccus albus]|uniref:Fur family ferric uptake transcriptional regulator n=1 Tax=Spelaeicoccus albus TaxID=1280376 RepID=A0A7Z0IIE5_9MICO|nr:transcriptional repressor [Spelaeicoccus albus]NYI68374.1 Fur family ferric uptake transcriptional regulator [Spelaeicoccus albus]